MRITQIKQIPWQKQLLFWAYIAAVCLLLRGFFFYQHLQADLQLPEAAPAPYLINIQSGQAFSSLTDSLEESGIIPSSFDLRLYARLSGKAEQVKAGEYVLEQGMSALEMLDKLVAGSVFYRQLSIPEGWTLAQALAQMQAHPHITASLDIDDAAQLQNLFATDYYPEGLFFPDTYNFSTGTSDRELLRRGATLMQQVLTEEWQRRAVGLPYDEPYDALIMASIIEKETGRAEERRLIAGVFVNRLLNNMRLQTDPTVIYGLGDRFTGDLTRANLQEQTPYNTYRINGLPPTPIALPGREAIAAALNPDISGYLYFVARGDGTHYFSTTLEEHNAAVERYQLGIEN
ncbi:MAG: hypothetical protein CMP91_05725 [Gammaproteobacteria bacterium]|nr:hypothetical protein [Gammaproteobacteria bacterium]MAY02503.1 hypothetical protein [Gammaproteobacteria bacterium]|tara:strand:- start:234 stop:1271 length:1038 start_codon:yes stop_codon:yes gene_type:complete